MSAVLTSSLVSPSSSRVSQRGSALAFLVVDLVAAATLVGVGTTLANRFGPQTLRLSSGLAIAYLGYRGAFAVLQTTAMRPKVMYTAWGVFLASLVMPGVLGEHSSFFSGAAAALMCIPLAVTKLLTGAGIPLLAIGIANAVQLCLPSLEKRLSAGQGEKLAAILAVTMLAALAYSGKGELSEAPLGMYVWNASFLLALIALPIRGRTFATMVSVFPVLVLWVAYFGK